MDYLALKNVIRLGEGMVNKIIMTIILLLLLSISAFGQIYLDSNLTSNCSGTYSIANRDCSGSDGNGYYVFNTAMNNLTSGNTLFIRQGIYRSSRVYPPTLTEMAYVKAFPNEAVTIKPLDASYNDADFPLIDLAYGRTIKISFENIEFDGEMQTNCTGSCRLNGGHSYHAPIYALNVSSSSIIEVHNCFIHDWGHAGLKGYANWLMEGNKMENIGFTGYDHGMYASNQITAIGNLIQGVSGCHFQLYGGTISSVYLDGNTLLRGGLDSNFSNNACILIWPSGTSSINATITNNVCIGQNRGFEKAGLVTGNYVVENNTFMNIDTFEYAIESASYFDSSNVITNNIADRTPRWYLCTNPQVNCAGAYSVMQNSNTTIKHIRE